MDTALLLARLVLAAVFAVAGVAKLLDLEGSRRALTGFGVPEKLAKPGGLALPIVEIIVAILLLPTATAVVGGIGALLLLLAFVGGIAFNMTKGRAPDCHCFGQLHSEPAGWRTLARNSVLSAVALFLVVGGWSDPGHSLVAWLGDLSTGERVLGAMLILAAIAIVAQGWLLVHLLGQNGRVLLRLDAIESMIAEGGLLSAEQPEPAPTQGSGGLPLGSPAPSFRLEGLHGETMTLDALRAPGKPVMLLFSDPGCGPCNALLPEVGKWQKEHAARLTIAMITRGTAEANKAKAAEHGLTHVLLQQDREVSNEFKAFGTPTAVIVRADGTIGSAVSGGAEAIRQLISKTTGTLSLNAVPVAPQRTNGNGNGAAAPNRPAAPAAPVATIGKPAPSIVLPDLDGKTVKLSDFRGSDTLVLFWNPGCGFCKRMVDDLKAWEANPPEGSPKMLIVSTGSAESNRELGLASPIVLDEGFNIGRAYGASGTPSAVLVDAKGKVKSAVAVGAPGVLALANGEHPANAAAAQPAPVKAAKVGDAAPAIALPDLDGNKWELQSNLGEKTMLLFWNPGCGFCKRMVDDIKEIEAQPPVGAPKLVLISTGTAESNKELGLGSLTLLDQGFNVGRSFGANGTPSAVLIDEEGKVASTVAVGAPAVLEMAGVNEEASL